MTTESREQRIGEQLPETLTFVADAMDANPMLHFDAALEMAHRHFGHEFSALLDEVVRLMQIGMTHFEALRAVAEREKIAALTRAVEYVVHAHQPDDSFITSETLRGAIEAARTASDE